MDYNINFPHLHIFLSHVGKSISIGGFGIAFYGMIIAIGMLMGIFVATREAKRTHQNPDDYIDLALWAIVFAIVGARLYYVIFSWDSYKNDLLAIFNTRGGGLAIYGGIIAAVITAFVVTKVKKIPTGLVLDTAGLGLVVGQLIGRWGNFFNREAFGGYTDNLFAMQLPISAVRSNEITAQMMDHVVTSGGVQYIQVHPAFLYESLWNLGLFILLMLIKDRKKFNGEVFIWYLMGYSLGRVWIEGLRTDQLLIGSTSIAVSQLLSGILIVVCLGIIVVKHKSLQKIPTFTRNCKTSSKSLEEEESKSVENK